jgi:RNA polymerase sigma factor (sigma-70 family)
MLNSSAWRPTVTPVSAEPVKARVADPFERLYRDEYRKVLAIAYRVLRDPQAAEDVAQEVFLKFHRQQSPLSERAAGWLHAAAVHTALNLVRGDRRRQRREAGAWDPSPPDDPAQVVEASHRRQEVRAALARLPERAAAILALRYSGLSYAEIATAMGVRIGNIGTMLRRAEEALRKEVHDGSSH